MRLLECSRNSTINRVSKPARHLRQGTSTWPRQSVGEFGHRSRNGSGSRIFAKRRIHRCPTRGIRLSGIYCRHLFPTISRSEIALRPRFCRSKSTYLITANTSGGLQVRKTHRVTGIDVNDNVGLKRNPTPVIVPELFWNSMMPRRLLTAGN